LPALPNGNSQSDESALDIPLMSLDEAEKAAIERAITKLNGNISKAARVLNVSRNTLYLKMKKYGIPY
jgi:transcriptional regulator of acetoin/glycerol metabolism